jgi:hypothetical protein
MKIGRGGSEANGSRQLRKTLMIFAQDSAWLEAGKLGVLLLQYPAGFHFSAENL